MLTTLAVALAFCTPVWALQAQAGGPLKFDVRLRLDVPAYPMGSPTFVDFELVNASRGPTQLEIDDYGLPWGLVLRLTDPDGRQSEARNLDQDPLGFPDGPPIPHKPSELYNFKAGESVAFRYDLARLFKLQRPGTYHLEVTQGEGGPIIRRVDFEVVGLETQQTIKIDGLCEPPSSLFEKNNAYAITTAPAECRLEIGKVRDRERGPWFAVISDVTITGRYVPRVAPPLVVPPKTRVAASAIDVRGRLWTVLEAEGASSLIIWDLKEARRRCAIPWGKHAIEMGSTPIRPDLKAKVVIAGVPGQPKMSTLREAQADG